MQKIFHKISHQVEDVPVRPESSLW